MFINIIKYLIVFIVELLMLVNENSLLDVSGILPNGK